MNRSEPNVPPPVRLRVPPVKVRLEGRDLHVTSALDVLRQVFAVSDVSPLYRNADGTVRLYVTISREFPYSGRGAR